jgi:hypothetical protein
MAKGKKRIKGLPTERADRAKLTVEESLKRLQEFTKRKEHFVAAARRTTRSELTSENLGRSTLCRSPAW